MVLSCYVEVFIVSQQHTVLLTLALLSVLELGVTGIGSSSTVAHVGLWNNLFLYGLNLFYQIKKIPCIALVESILRYLISGEY